MIAAVLCDLGGVLVDAPFDAFTALEGESGAARGAVRDINRRNPDRNAWARIERGEITTDEFVELFTDEARAAGHRLPARQIIDVVHSITAPADVADAAMVAALRSCQDAGLRLALVTNNVRPLGASPEAGWLFELFDVVIESCVAGTRKPELEIYRRALNGLGVAAEQAVMLDDLGINLKPARALGMTTIKVVDPQDAARELIEIAQLPLRRSAGR